MPTWTATLLLAFCTTELATGVCKPVPLSATVQQYHVRNLPLIEAILELGRTEKICFGLESFDKSLLQRRVNLDRYNTSVRALLAEILAAAPELETVAADGVVLVRRKTRPEQSWLNFVLPEFSSRRSSVQEASMLLYMTMATAAQPSLQGFAGSYPPGDLNDLVGPFHETRKTMRELLSLLVRNSRGGMWVVEGGTAFEKLLPPNPFWVVIQYAEPQEVSVGRVRNLTVTPASAPRAALEPSHFMSFVQR